MDEVGDLGSKSTKKFKQEDILSFPQYPEIRFKENIVVVDKSGRGHFENCSSMCTSINANHSISSMFSSSSDNRQEGASVVMVEGEYDEVQIHLNHVYKSCQFLGDGKVEIGRTKVRSTQSDVKLNDNMNEYLMFFHDQKNIDLKCLNFELMNERKIEEMYRNDKQAEELRFRSCGIICFVDCENILIEDCNFKSPNVCCVKMRNCNNVTFKNCIFMECREGTSLVKCKNVKVEGCEFSKCYDHGFGLIESSNVEFHKCMFLINSHRGLDISYESKNVNVCVCVFVRSTLVTSNECSSITVNCCTFRWGKGYEFVGFNSRATGQGCGVKWLLNSEIVLKNSKFEEINQAVQLCLGAGGKIINNTFQSCVSAVVICDNKQGSLFIDRNKFSECEDIISFFGGKPPVIGKSNKKYVTSYKQNGATIKKLNRIHDRKMKNLLNLGKHSYRSLLSGSEMGVEDRKFDLESNKKFKPPKKYNCRNCKKKPSKDEKFKVCGGCRMVYYCGRDCQMKDWKGRHRGECKKIKKYVEEELEDEKNVEEYHQWENIVQRIPDYLSDELCRLVGQNDAEGLKKWREKVQKYLDSLREF